MFVNGSQAYAGPGGSTDFSIFTPFNSASYFHPYCPINNYDDQWQSENCYLGDNSVSLTDLDTQNSEVRRIWYDWVEGIVSEYSSKLSSITKDGWFSGLTGE